MPEPYRWLYDPARIAATLILVPERFYADYLATQQQQANLEALPPLEPMSDSSLPSLITNLLVGVDCLTNGTVEVQIGWPAGFTNKLEIFATTNLPAASWQLIYTNIATVGETNFFWIDEDATNLPHRVYTVGNADIDTDEDTLTDA